MVTNLKLYEIWLQTWNYMRYGTTIWNYMRHGKKTWNYKIYDYKLEIIRDMVTILKL